MSKRATIGVFGSGRIRPGEPAYQTAFELGMAIARAGWVLCNGGYGGIMEASARGAGQAGGHTIGVSCSAFGRSGVNAYVGEEVRTDRLDARLAELMARSDGYVVLPGGTGTLLELAMVWELRNKRLAPAKPIVLLGDYWRAVVQTAALDDPDAPAGVHMVQDVPEAIEVLRAELRNE